MEYYKNLSLEDLFYIDDDGLVCCEEWRYIPNYEGKYIASCLGRLKSIDRLSRISNGNYRCVKGRILKQQKDKDGYLQFGLYTKGKYKTNKSHRIIALLFVKNPQNKPDVNHKSINGDKTNNRFNNLEWVTKKENTEHAWENGLAIAKKGIEQYNSKLTNEQVLEIRECKDTHVELAKKYNVGKSTIGAIKTRITWKHI